MRHLLIFTGGAAVASAVAGLATSGLLHKAAVATTAFAMRVGDAVNAETRTIADEAADARAAARREARIDAAVRERLAAEEARIRAEVISQLDGVASE